MSRKSRTIAAFTLLAALRWVQADAGPAKSSYRTVTVVLCDSVGIAREVHAAARETAARVYQMIGVDIVWRDMVDQASETGAAPVGAFGPVTFYVRLVPLAWQPPALTALGAMGFTTIGGRVASVVFERVVDLARAERLSAADLLGYAIAHEVGHLLLGARPHAVGGIMSETIDRRGCAQRSLGFARDEAVVVRARLEATSEPASR